MLGPRRGKMAIVPANQAEFEFSGGPYTGGELAVVGFRGREALSEPFGFAIELASRETIDTKKLVGAAGQLVMHPPHGDTRFIHGFVRRVELVGERREGRRYR